MNNSAFDPKWRIGIHPISEGTVFAEVIGKSVYIGPYVMIGHPAEILSKWVELPWGKVIIGDQVRIEGLVTVDSGYKSETILGIGCYLMKHSHVGHDAKLGEGVILSPGAKIGGECLLGNHVNVGMNAVIHQQVRIPEKCMIGMGAVVTKKAAKQMKAGETWAGNPARYISPNFRWL